MYMDNIRILLADDHAVVRAGIRDSLRSHPNWQIIEEAADGMALLDALHRAPFDLLLVDVTMPSFDPVPTIREIRIRYPNLRILVVSAYDDDVYVQGLLKAGVHGYHLKDQPLDEIPLAVQQVLAGERWISSPLINRFVERDLTPDPVPALTTRQYELLRLLQKGLDNHTIAKHMGLSIKTIENHLTRLYRQLNVQNRLEAVVYATQHPEILSASAGGALLSTKVGEEWQAAGPPLLLVDDNPRYRHKLRGIIGRLCPGAAISEADSIDEAISLVQANHYDAAFVDIILGEQDGISCTRRIKAVSPDTRVILITAYPDREFRRQGIAAGAAAMIDKRDLDDSAIQQIIEDVSAPK
jgi:DNA-binding NarL/FixJ family response regulator